VAATGTDPLAPELLVSCHVGESRHELYIPFSSEGIDRTKLAKRDDYSAMNWIWHTLQQQVLVSYGATRNLSDYIDTRYARVDRQVQRQMTLFDPLTQIAHVEALLQGGRDVAPALETLSTLLRRVLEEQDIGRMVFDKRGDRLRFQRDSTTLEALDLPDGFRSTVAWLADLCVAWHQAAPGRTRGADPAEITGIALIDEIDLHLHATLQRGLIPALRKALPKVQFIVTTHSPLVLSSFDRSELIILDRDAEGGVRELDRQLFGMSMDDIYQWLMGTVPESPVIEALLREADPKAALLLAQTPRTSESEAEEKLARRRAFLKRVQMESEAAGGTQDPPR
jgi:hypothetical protein